MKISFDFDDTLTEDPIKRLAEALIGSGCDVWVVTSRMSNEPNIDLYLRCDEIGLPHDKVLYTNGSFKKKTYLENGFDLHYDDDWEEVHFINKSGGAAILVKPDFEQIYSDIQYNKYTSL